MSALWGFCDRPSFIGCESGPPAKTCQYIAGNPREDPTKCGARSKPGSSYCPDHHARCYRPADKRELLK